MGFKIKFLLMTFTQNTILRLQRPSKLNLMLLTFNTRITSANAGEFYRIFTFSFSFWALFDTQLMNFI